jgi:hypothetical protein
MIFGLSLLLRARHGSGTIVKLGTVTAHRLKFEAASRLGPMLDVA